MKTVAAIFVLLVMGSCTNLDPGQQITYRVNGGKFFVQYQAGDNPVTDTSAFSIWTAEWKGHAGDQIYIKAFNNGSPGGMSVMIDRDGIPWKTEGMMEPYDSITIDEKLPFAF